MPAPAYVIVAVITGTALSSAVVYFFVSNRAAGRREEYLRQVNEVLELLTQKAEKLVEKIRWLEREAEELRREKARLERELAATKLELEIMKAESANWQQAASALGLTSKLAVVRSSQVLSMVHYRPSKALENLKKREVELKDELRELD